MNQFLPFIVIGLATGAAYGLAGVGLVLTYTTSGIFNFGYGAVAALVAFVFYLLHVDHGMSWPLAAAISVVVAAPILGVLLELMARSLSGVTETIKVTATVGLILIAEAIGLLWHPQNEPTFPNFLSQGTVRLLGVNVTWDQIIVFGFSLVASAVLWWFFRALRPGIVMRAVVDDADLVAMSGDDPVRVRRWAWIIGTVFAGVAGLMLAPEQPVDGITLATVVFAAFGAAAIGWFVSLPMTFVGGLVVGVVGALVDKYAATIPWIGGIPASLPFIVLFAVLLVAPKRRLAPARPVVHRAQQAARRLGTPAQLGVGVVVLGLLAAVPAVQATHIAVWSAALVDVVLFLSLGLLVRRSGQISLCQLAFAAVGAAAFGHFAGDHLPWLLAVVLATVVAIPIGAIVAIPAIRVSGVYLALATLGLGILAQGVFYTRSYMFGSSPLGIAEPRPDVSIGPWHLFTDRGFYYLLLVIVVAVVALFVALTRGRLGRLLGGLAESPLALETNGTTTSVLKVIVFCIAAAMASLAGALTGMLYHYGVGTYFPPFDSIYIVAIVVVLTMGDPWYALVAAVGYAVIPGYVQGTTVSSVLELLFGVAAVLAAYLTRMGGLPAPLRTRVDRLAGVLATHWGSRVRPAPVRAPAAAEGLAAEGLVAPSAPAPARGRGGPSVPAAVAPAGVLGTDRRSGDGPAGAVAAGSARQRRRSGGAGAAGLVVDGLSVAFGGVRAVDGVSLRAPLERITGLVGPNGAGKTTTFNACSGMVRPAAGRILLGGEDVRRVGVPGRARRGLGRTFQRTELCGGLTVRQNIALGCEAAWAGANPLTHVAASRRSRAAVDAAVDRAIALTGLGAIAEERAGPLPIGQRRLVELARVLAGPFDVLLLDEPSSGMDGNETGRFGEVLRTVVAERGCGVLLVEHDMALVRSVCAAVYVLEFGRLIFEGTPEDMLADAAVRAAYLGDDAGDVTRGAGSTGASKTVDDPGGPISEEGRRVTGGEMAAPAGRGQDVVGA